MNEQKFLDNLAIGNHYINRYGEELEIIKLYVNDVVVNFIETNYSYRTSIKAVLKGETKDKINRYQLLSEGLRICNKCGETKKTYKFPKFRGCCETCYNTKELKAYQKEYRLKNKEEIRRKNKIYYHNHVDEYQKRKEKYKLKNKEKMKQYQKEYQIINKEKIKLRLSKNKAQRSITQKIYRDKNRDRLIANAKEKYIEKRDIYSIKSREYRLKNIVAIKKSKKKHKERNRQYRVEYCSSDENKAFIKLGSQARRNPDKYKVKYEKEKNKRAAKRKQKQKNKDDSLLLTNTYIKRQLSTKFDIPFSDIPADLIELQRALIKVQRQKNWRT